MAIIKQLAPHRKLIRKVPDISDYASGRIQVSDFKRIDIEDLLGRVAIKTDPFLLKSCIENKTVMVTGAGGSIGSELSRQIAKLKPPGLILYEIGELALYTIEKELNRIHNHKINIYPVLGDIKNINRLTQVFNNFNKHIRY